MENLSVIILTKNEEKNILDCIETIEEVGEIIIIDDYSTDRTLDVIRGLANDKIRIFQHRLDGDFSSQRNFGLSKVKNEWVLFLDADERVSNGLKKEISEKSFAFDGIYIKRTDIMWGRKLTHGETGNIKLLRLGKKGSGKWKGKVHEIWDIKGNVDTFDNALIHYPHPHISDFLYEVNFYSTLRAKELFDKNTKVNVWQMIFFPKAKFFVNYFGKLGFADGLPGFVFAMMMSLHSFLVRAKLWMLTSKL